MPTRSTTPIKLCGLVAAALAVSAALMVSLLASSAAASTKQVSIIQDNSILSDPAAALPRVRELGATTVRVFVSWYSLAPNGAAKSAPKGFKGSDPNAYATSRWQPYDTLVQTAKQMGITVDFELTGGSPRWASGANVPANSSYVRNRAYQSWEPNAKLYGQFVHAVTERYDGSFKPAGAKAALPAVHFWSFWNEPDFGQDLGPQAIDGSTKPVAPKYYRALLNAGWTALHQTQPGARNTTLIGELAAGGYSGYQAPGHPGRLPGNASITHALAFLRATYCVGSNYRPLTGSLAKLYSCPTSAAASRRFRAQNPALFSATGFADHPYDSTEAPNANPATVPTDSVTFPVLNRLTTALGKVTKAYRSGKHFPIYNDEYGYITRPPGNAKDPSTAKAAIELNQAEYLSYKNPRLASYDQYLIDDPRPNPGPGFSSGLFTSKGKAKATLDAYRLPVWLPKTSVRAGSSTEIWGGARAAAFSRSATSRTAPTVTIQVQKGGRGSWTTFKTVQVSTATGYFDIHTTLPHSGNLRLAYRYPETEPFLPPKVAGSTIYSRTVRITVNG